MPFYIVRVEQRRGGPGGGTGGRRIVGRADGYATQAEAEIERDHLETESESLIPDGTSVSFEMVEAATPFAALAVQRGRSPTEVTRGVMSFGSGGVIVSFDAGNGALVLLEFQGGFPTIDARRVPLVVAADCVVWRAEDTVGSVADLRPGLEIAMHGTVAADDIGRVTQVEVRSGDNEVRIARDPATGRLPSGYFITGAQRSPPVPEGRLSTAVTLRRDGDRQRWRIWVDAEPFAMPEEASVAATARYRGQAWEIVFADSAMDAQFARLMAERRHRAR